MHEENCFVTLTYDDENLPFGGPRIRPTLHRPDFQKFMKRLIKKTNPIRLFYCGEYGEKTFRPHYHALLFGYRPKDGSLYSEKNGVKLYTSLELTSTWGLGHVTFGECTFESAAYTARYITKKINGDLAETFYQDRVHPFSGMSRRDGIGLTWLKKYGADTYSKDQIVIRSKAMKPPRAYDIAFEKTCEKTNSNAWKKVRAKRASANFKKTNPVNLDPAVNYDRRLWAGQKINEQKLQIRENMK